MKDHNVQPVGPVPPVTYELIWRNKFLTDEATSLEDMFYALEGAASHLREMQEGGVVLRDDGGVADDYAVLVTTDPAVAERFGFEPASDSEDDDRDDEDLDDEDLDDESDDFDDEDFDGEDQAEAEERDPTASIEVHAVSEGEHTKGWVHTHGMEQYGLPELEVRNVPLFLVRDAAALLRCVCNYMLNDPKPVLAGQNMLSDDAPLHFIDAIPIPGEEEHYRHPRLQIVDIDTVCDSCSGR